MIFYASQLIGNFTKCLKNQPCEVIKMRGEGGKKPPKKEINNPLFS